MSTSAMRLVTNMAPARLLLLLVLLDGTAGMNLPVGICCVPGLRALTEGARVGWLSHELAGLDDLGALEGRALRPLRWKGLAPMGGPSGTDTSSGSSSSTAGLEGGLAAA